MHASTEVTPLSSFAVPAGHCRTSPQFEGHDAANPVGWYGQVVYPPGSATVEQVIALLPSISMSYGELPSKLSMAMVAVL